MKVIVEHVKRRGRTQVTETTGVRTAHCCKLIAEHGGRQLVAGSGEELPSTGKAVAMSPTFGMQRVFHRTG